MASQRSSSVNADGIVSMSFELKGKELGCGGLTNVEYSPKYEITLDKRTGLPSKIVQYLKNRKDTITTRFLKYDLNPKDPAPGAWTPAKKI
jgi:hypothetical protein